MPQNLRNTLRDTRDQLHQLRKSVAAHGHVHAMRDIDSLMGIAEEDAARKLKVLEMADFRATG